MGKRSSFERRENDFYPTPAPAVLPLIPHLRGIRTFAEPCCGDGDLVRHLESAGLRCVYAADIRAGQDALAPGDYGDIDAIITNPPHARNVMHRLIEHFQHIAPTWLLIDHDWAATKQAAPLLRACSDIVSIGRVRWIPGSRWIGKDNYAWYRFDARHTDGPVFHCRDRQEQTHRAERCLQCGVIHQARRAGARYCSDACRQRAYRERLAVTQT